MQINILRKFTSSLCVLTSIRYICVYDVEWNDHPLQASTLSFLAPKNAIRKFFLLLTE